MLTTHPEAIWLLKSSCPSFACFWTGTEKAALPLKLLLSVPLGAPGGGGGCVCVWRAESEQPSKRKLSQSFWHRHRRVVPFLILHEVRHFRQMPVFVNEGRWTDIHNVCPIHSVGCRSAAEGHSCQSAELKSVIMGAIVVSVIVLRVSTLTAQSDNQSGAPTI